MFGPKTLKLSTIDPTFSVISVNESPRTYEIRYECGRVCGLKSSSYRVQSDSFSVIGQSNRLDIGVTYCTRLFHNDMNRCMADAKKLKDGLADVPASGKKRQTAMGTPPPQ
jgi:hypothetical protein